MRLVVVGIVKRDGRLWVTEIFLDAGLTQVRWTWRSVNAAGADKIFFFFFFFFIIF